jgi:tryptophan 2,3-dioxygenase
MDGEAAIDKGPGVYQAHELTYNDYLKVPELLGLQQLLSDPPSHDETLFIIMHQTYELWFKQILHEFDAIVDAMREDRFLAAHHFTNRVVEIMKVLIGQIQVLETMAPGAFLEFRDRLNPASGFQSLQFREIEFRAGIKDPRYLASFKYRPDYLETMERRLEEPDLRETYNALLLRNGFADAARDSELPTAVADDAEQAELVRALIAIYARPKEYLPIYLLSESLIDFDERLAQWRQHHVLMVERIIGRRPGTGGSAGVDYLEKTTVKRAFPLLWEVRGVLTKSRPY